MARGKKKTKTKKTKKSATGRKSKKKAKKRATTKKAAKKNSRAKKPAKPKKTGKKKKATSKRKTIKKKAAKKKTTPAKKAGSKSKARAKAPARKGSSASRSNSTKPLLSAIAPSVARPKESKNPSVKWDQFFVPLDNRVLIEQDDPFEKTPGGLYIPASGQDRPNQGKVVSVGRGHLTEKGKLHPTEVRVGDQVMYGKYSGEKVNLQGAEMVLVREEDIIGIID